MILYVFLLVVIVGLAIWYNPKLFFIPVNTMLIAMDAAPRPAFYSPEACKEIFPVSMELEAEWVRIRDEGRAAFRREAPANYLNNYNVDLGHEDTRNWTTVPLRLFGKDCVGMATCPILSALLRAHPEIVSCIFSRMEPGKIIQPHVGPYDGLIRYQLALDIPDAIAPPRVDPFDGTVEANECFLHVDGQRYYWTPGQGILFDETYLHGVVNTTTSSRMVLLIDVQRPYARPLARFINRVCIMGMGVLTGVVS